MNDLMGWLTQTVGVGTVAGLVYKAANWAQGKLEQRVTFSAWIRAGLSEPTLRLVAYNRKPAPIFVQDVRLGDMAEPAIFFAEKDRGGMFEMLAPGPPFARIVPRRTWDFPMEMPNGLPSRVTLIVVGYEGAPDRLRTWKVPVMITIG